MLDALIADGLLDNYRCTIIFMGGFPTRIIVQLCQKYKIWPKHAKSFVGKFQKVLKKVVIQCETDINVIADQFQKAQEVLENLNGEKQPTPEMTILKREPKRSEVENQAAPAPALVAALAVAPAVKTVTSVVEITNLLQDMKLFLA